MRAYDSKLSLELLITDVVVELIVKENDGSVLLRKNLESRQVDNLETVGEDTFCDCSLERTVWPIVFHLDYQELLYILSQLICSPPVSRPVKLKGIYIFKMIVNQPKKYFMDPKANEILVMMLVEKRELEHSLNWLSTLGGAFSALGENSISFAHRAGKVSKDSDPRLKRMCVGIWAKLKYEWKIKKKKEVFRP
ncbi:unnamed protein product [Allacma fusca]|uniref:Uncharacterized protein n=1 Tax=Allacma fusca TaxID=39272 RepID=A0A8J2LAC2_9HEXA|nr:unnamed protein product [Allacma fusca]